jgi:iron complex outermembrane receptor protein
MPHPGDVSLVCATPTSLQPWHARPSRDEYAFDERERQRGGMLRRGIAAAVHKNFLQRRIELSACERGMCAARIIPATLVVESIGGGARDLRGVPSRARRHVPTVSRRFSCMFNRRSAFRSLLLAAASGAALTSPALAQTQSAQAPALEEIVVTAQRREETLQRTPVSVTAFTAETLANRQINNVIDTAAYVPNLVIETTTGVPNAARIFLRGVGEDIAQPNADGAVGFYVDNVFYARTNGALFDFNDIERIEVLRGPQGTLYGRNTSAGAVKIISKKPSNDLEASAEGTFGRFNRFDFKARIAGPIVKDKLAVSFSGLIRERDGTSFSTTLGKRVNDKDVKGFRASALYTPTDRFELWVTYDRVVDQSDSGVPTSLNVSGAPNRTTLVVGRPTDIFTTQAGRDPRAGFRSNGLAINASYKLSDALTIGSITGLRDIYQNGNLDNDAEARPISEFGFDTTQHQISQEVTLAADFDRLKALAGVFYFGEYNVYSAYNYSQPRGNPAAPVTYGIDYSDQDTTSYAGFGQVSYEVIDRLTLTGGLRWTRDHKNWLNVYPFLNVASAAEKTWTKWTPKFTADYQLTDDVLLFAGYSKGYKAGGFNRANRRDVATTPYNPENVTTYEAGAKTEWLDGRLRANLTYFYNDYKDLQYSVFDVTFTPPATRRFNAAAATTQGVELEAQVAVTDELLVYGNLGYLDAKYDEFFDFVNGVRTDVSFRKLKGAPKWQTALGFTYTRPIGDNAGTVRLSADYKFRARVFNNVANTRETSTRPLNLLDASLAYTTPDERWTFTLAGKNLTNVKYWGTSIFIGGTLASVYPSDPRTWSVSARWNF